MALATGAVAPAGQNMIGRQSQNEGLPAAPAPGPVVVDGKLEDWDWSGRICSFADQGVRNRYAAETAAMWTPGALYLAIKRQDPTPLVNMVDPEFNLDDGWKGDSIQLRINTGDQTIWLTGWYYTPKKQAVLHLAYWKDRTNCRAGQDVLVFTATNDVAALGRGVEMAFRAEPDGKGYVQEIRLPWALLFKNVPAIGPGLPLQIGLEFFWGDPTGKTWPVHRYADNMQPGMTSREFYWSASKVWGEAALLAKGRLAPRQYISEADRLTGTLPLRVTVPKAAARVTLAINDAAGKRIRNLAGDLLPEDYTVATDRDTRTLEVPWDLLDDGGTLVPAGDYRVAGLTHGGLGAEYEMCFYNPGTPPWDTTAGNGAWGADHSVPLRVARAGDGMVVAWPFAEGGDGIIGIGPDDRKRWGEKRGAQLLAADADSLYAIPGGWHIKSDVLIRMTKKSGAYKPFQKDGQLRPFELPFKDLFGNEDFGPASLAVTDRQLIVLLRTKNEAANQCRLAFLDKDSAAVLKLVDTPPLVAIAAAADGTLFGMDTQAVYHIGAADGKLVRISTPGLAQPAALAVDNQANIVVADVGADMQVKAFTPAGQPAYTCGRKGSRPLRGKFDPQSMRAMSSVAVDQQGRVWVVENWEYPRRVSVWNPQDGSLVRDYIGNTGYAAVGTVLHDTNPNLAYVGPNELALDKTNRAWHLTQVLWVPDVAAGEGLAISAQDMAPGNHFTATVNGRPHEYYFSPPYRPYNGYVLYMECANGWQPVAAITTVGRVCRSFNGKGEVEHQPSGDFADLNAFDVVFWNDRNGDGKVQRAECEVVKTDEPPSKKQRGKAALPMSSGWGERMVTNFVFFMNGISKVAPLSFSAEGAPVFGPQSLTQMAFNDAGDFVPVAEENLLLCLNTGSSARKPAHLAGWDTQTGAQRWQYPNPYPGVHGSHRATMPQAGMLIGPLRICGVAQVNAEVGRVFLVRGNLGQDYFLTTDGLFIGAMFQDGRLPAERLPAKEEQLVGMPMEGFSHGGEPFNGWFGKQADGKIRMTTGFPRQAGMILTVNGLDSIRRFAGPALTIKVADLAAADRDNQARAAKAAPPAAYTVKRLAAPLKVDGVGGEWKDIPALEIARKGFPFKGAAKLAYDAQNLYLLYTVEDPSPWLNTGKDYTRLFKTGDAIDLQLCIDPKLTDRKKRRDPAAGDVRLLISQLDKKPVAVLMKPVDKDAPAGAAVQYQSPVGVKSFDCVELLRAAQIAVRKGDGQYTIEAALPLAALGLVPEKGFKLRGDLGFISSDEQGTLNVARTYWANKDTNLVNDLPQEAWLNPETWGLLIFE